MNTIMHRALYDQDFLDSGCTLPFSDFELTNADNTFATYMTNYVILGTGLIFGALLFPRHELLTTWKFMPLLFFVCTGIGFGVAGVGHQVVTRTDDNIATVLVNISYAFTVLGFMFLLLIGVSFFAPGNKIVFSSIVVLSVALIVAGPIISDLDASTFLMQGAMGLLASLFVIAAYLMQAARGDGSKYRWLLVGKVFFVLLQLSSFIIQVLLAGVCGSAGYETCFEQCPLPLSFNHNALFHVVFWIGFVGYGVCEWIHPSLFYFNQQEEEQLSTTKDAMASADENDIHGDEEQASS